MYGVPPEKAKGTPQIDADERLGADAASVIARSHATYASREKSQKNAYTIIQEGNDYLQVNLLPSWSHIYKVQDHRHTKLSCRCRVRH